MKAEGIIQKVIRKWVEWEGLDKNVDLLDVEQDLIEEIKNECTNQTSVDIETLIGIEGLKMKKCWCHSPSYWDHTSYKCDRSVKLELLLGTESEAVRK